PRHHPELHPFPTRRSSDLPFHLYDEAGIRENARRLHKAFAWNPGFKEYFAVKATPNPRILQILREEGCGVDCATLTELLLAEAVDRKSTRLNSSHVKISYA